MSKKFLASVGNAQLLKNEDGKLVHIADIKTLTESTLSFSTSMEEVRAGEGAKLYGRFSHDAGMTVTLTDAMFDLNYIALQTGSAIEGNASAFYTDEDFTISEGKIVPSKAVANIGEACGLQFPMVWVKEKGCGVDADYEALESPYTLPTSLASKTADQLCVKYFITKPEARKLAINANFIPAECVLLLTTKLFAGDANAKETGKEAGFITVKVPRFQLDGQFDLSMAMSSAATMSLNGTALAVEDGTCDGAGIYAEIVEVETDSNAATGLVEIEFDPEVNKVGSKPVIFGEYKDGHISTIDNTEFTFSPALDDNGAFANAGTQNATLVADNSFTANITVVA